jgi:hypothetical protein
MALGTGYDLYLVHQSHHFFSENYTYEITRASPPHLGERSIKLSIGNIMQKARPSPSKGVINHGKSLIDYVKTNYCDVTELGGAQITSIGFSSKADKFICINLNLV